MAVPSELFRLFLPSSLRPGSAPVSSPGFGYVQVQDLAASVETDLGLPVPGPSDKMSLGLKEQCPRLPCALAWRLRVARRSLRPQAAACWVQWLPITQLFLGSGCS